MSKRYAHHKYTWSRPYGSERHQWEFVGPFGGVHFTASIYDGKATCGLEFHFNRLSAPAPTEEAPHHIKCWLTGESCWHDGTSLYADEQLWPRIKHLLSAGKHDAIFAVLEAEADNRFPRTDRRS